MTETVHMRSPDGDVREVEATPSILDDSEGVPVTSPSVRGSTLLCGLLFLCGALLFGGTAHDPLTVGGIGWLRTGVALLARGLPARRAARVDPVDALRGE